MRITPFIAAIAGLLITVAAVQAQDSTSQGGQALPGGSASEPATPDDFAPSHLALAQDVIEITQSDTAFDDILPRLATQTQDLFTRSNPALAREIEETVFAVAVEMAQRRVELSTVLQMIWARRFGEDELTELKAFFVSPLGKKFVELTPSITALSVGAARQWEQTLSAAMVEGTRSKLREKGYAL